MDTGTYNSSVHTPVPDMPLSGRVLLVDDDTTLLRVYVRWLEALGFTVECATDASTAIDRLTKSSFDVIISDIALQGVDGLQLLRVIRGHDLDVPVILMTGNPAPETALRAVEYGALRYLVKPFEQSALHRVVAHAIRLRKVAQLKRQALALVGNEVRQVGDLTQLTADFENALSTIWMAYQPILSWSQKRVFAYEALLRCDERPLLPPRTILEAAEQLGRLRDVGRVIRGRVAEVIELAPSRRVCVNLHAQDLLDDSLYMSHAPLSRFAEQVVFEITERESLNQIADLTQRVTRLRGMGFRIAIDNLGSGDAGLTAFAQLEPDIVKLDMSLIRKVHESDTKRNLLRSMTALFAELGILVIAEGVETAAERDAVVASGCDLLQGYLFAKPGKPFPLVTW